MDLKSEKCVPCEGGVKPLPMEMARELMKELDPAWKLEGGRIERTFKFKDFKQAMAFTNKVGEVAETQAHHPDIHIEGWNKVRIVLYTHAINGLHQNDFIMAAKIDGLI